MSKLHFFIFIFTITIFQPCLGNQDFLSLFKSLNNDPNLTKAILSLYPIKRSTPIQHGYGYMGIINFLKINRPFFSGFLSKSPKPGIKSFQDGFQNEKNIPDLQIRALTTILREAIFISAKCKLVERAISLLRLALFVNYGRALDTTNKLFSKNLFIAEGMIFSIAERLEEKRNQIDPILFRKIAKEIAEAHKLLPSDQEILELMFKEAREISHQDILHPQIPTTETIGSIASGFKIEKGEFETVLTSFDNEQKLLKEKIFKVIRSENKDTEKLHGLQTLLDSIPKADFDPSAPRESVLKSIGKIYSNVMFPNLFLSFIRFRTKIGKIISE